MYIETLKKRTITRYNSIFISLNSSFLAGLIAVVIFVVVTGLAITARFLYRRKETYRNQEVKGVNQDDSPDFPFNNQADPQNASSENPKEYFIWCPDELEGADRGGTSCQASGLHTALRAAQRLCWLKWLHRTWKAKTEQFTQFCLLLYIMYILMQTGNSAGLTRCWYLFSETVHIQNCKCGSNVCSNL